MKRNWIIPAFAIAVAAIAVGYRTADGKPEQTPAPAAKDVKEVKEDRKPDEVAIRKLMDSFTAAFEKGDAAAVAALLTTGAEIIPDDGPTLRGRENIQKAFAAHFAKNPKGVKITMEADSTRFTSRDTAVEEGQMTVNKADGKVTTNKYSVLYVREDGKWLVGLVREWDNDEPVLNDLAFLIGTWSSKRADVEIQSTYEWFGNKKFIRAQFTIREKDKTFSGMQLIGTDPETGNLITWVFEHDGGFGQGTVTQDGRKWVFEMSTILPNGSNLEAMNILSPVDKDTFTWQPANLTIDGEQSGNLPPVKVTRVKK